MSLRKEQTFKDLIESYHIVIIVQPTNQTDAAQFRQWAAQEFPDDHLLLEPQELFLLDLHDSLQCVEFAQSGFYPNTELELDSLFLDQEPRLKLSFHEYIQGAILLCVGFKGQVEKLSSSQKHYDSSNFKQEPSNFKQDYSNFKQDYLNFKQDYSNFKQESSNFKQQDYSNFKHEPKPKPSSSSSNSRWDQFRSKLRRFFLSTARLHRPLVEHLLLSDLWIFPGYTNLDPQKTGCFHNILTKTLRQKVFIMEGALFLAQGTYIERWEAECIHTLGRSITPELEGCWPNFGWVDAHPVPKEELMAVESPPRVELLVDLWDVTQRYIELLLRNEANRAGLAETFDQTLFSSPSHAAVLTGEWQLECLMVLMKKYPHLKSTLIPNPLVEWVWHLSFFQFGEFGSQPEVDLNDYYSLLYLDPSESKLLETDTLFQKEYHQSYIQYEKPPKLYNFLFMDLSIPEYGNLFGDLQYYSPGLKDKQFLMAQTSAYEKFLNLVKTHGRGIVTTFVQPGIELIWRAHILSPYYHRDIMSIDPLLRIPFPFMQNGQSKFTKEMYPYTNVADIDWSQRITIRALWRQTYNESMEASLFGFRDTENRMDPLLIIDRDAFALIFNFLFSPLDLIASCGVCTKWRTIIQNLPVWEAIFLRQKQYHKRSCSFPINTLSAYIAFLEESYNNSQNRTRGLFYFDLLRGTPKDSFSLFDDSDSETSSFSLFD